MLFAHRGFMRSGRRSFFRVPASALALWILSVAAIAQRTTPIPSLSISGWVKDEKNNQLITAATLDLQHSSGDSASPSIVSGTGGDFFFAHVGSGDYIITVHAKGYETAVVPVMLGAVALANVTIAMRAEAGRQATPGDPISTHQLSIPDHARDEFDKGMKEMVSAKVDYHRALTHFERAIQEFPDYYEAYAEVGIIQHHLGDKAAAEQALRKSAELSEDRYLDALSLLAQMLNDEERFSDSEHFARTCATQDESAWVCDLELARSLSGLKRASEAEPIAVKARDLNPNNAGTFLILGNIHIQERKYADVVNDFDMYLKLNPSGPESDQVRAAEQQARRALARTEGAAAPAKP
jgi:hypothetical protein